MAPFDGLPADQRAVLQLVLRRGRSYDEIARLLSIDRAAVRERALAAFDALGPHTWIPAERRALITDYLLAQLSEPASEETRERLAASTSERAWAQALFLELAPLASSALPDIPMEAAMSREREADAERETDVVSSAPAGEASMPTTPGHAGVSEPETSGGRPSFRLGAAVLLAAAVVGVVIVLMVSTKDVRPATPLRPDSGIAYVSIVRYTNVAGFAAGENTDKILGDEAATYSLTVHRAGPSTDTFRLTSKVVFYSPTGSLTGTASATMTISAKKAETFTSGELSLKDGAGSQKGHSLIATFTGTGSLSANVYVLNYKGAYK
jgi:hypothetical protein